MRHILASICARPDTAGWNRAALPENDDGRLCHHRGQRLRHVSVNPKGTFSEVDPFDDEEEVEEEEEDEEEEEEATAVAEVFGHRTSRKRASAIIKLSQGKAPRISSTRCIF